MSAVADALVAAQARLAEAGCDTPRLDAEVLLAKVLGCERAALVIGARDELDPAVGRDFTLLVERRAAREPVAYITGIKEFRRISLAVDRRVLIPRPETELLVEVGRSLDHGVRVLDVGTGSGAVALALKDERPDLTVVGIDVSEDALALARSNASRLGLDVRFAVADLLDGDEYDAVLANLPYVAEECSQLAPEIALYEPPVALFGGRDGLDVVRRLISLLGAVPMAALEVGFDQADAVSALLERAGLRSVQRLRDLAGHERVVIGRR
jgi:release factor glutamine methyltransferase